MLIPKNLANTSRSTNLDMWKRGEDGGECTGGENIPIGIECLPVPLGIPSDQQAQEIACSFEVKGRDEVAYTDDM
jgi:hypothetical protein